MTNTNLILIGVIVVFGMALLYMYMQKNGAQSKEPMNDTQSGNAEPQPTPQPPAGKAQEGGLSPEMSSLPCLVMFHADWCGHCKHLAPEWEKVKQAVGDKHLIVDIESKNPLMRNFTLKGFPTIRYFPEGLGNANKFEEYQGDRTADTILKFLSAQMTK
ncbi:MAG TPA: protein disulfide isomerase family protein [Saprospiraceae bacterium]|nr:protein disulfide isomerase family protein [Saprospiraceae bacterium]